MLAQIIFEEEAKGQTMLPANFLRQLIRLYGDTLQGFVPGYLEASMETFAPATMIGAGEVADQERLPSGSTWNGS